MMNKRITHIILCEAALATQHSTETTAMHEATIKPRRFDVWRYENYAKVHIGIVTTHNQTLADSKAINLYGRGVWTTERE